MFYYVLTYQELAENKRYKHLQQAIVPLAAKLAIVAWLVITAVVFAFVGSFAAYVSDVAQANSLVVESNY